MEIKRLEKFRNTGAFNWINYEQIAGNTSFEDAHIVVVAEEHYARTRKELRFLGLRKRYLEITWTDSRQKVRELLSRNTIAGDMLLRESHALGKRYKWQKAHNEFGINKGVEVRGWDKMRLVRKCRRWNKRARKTYLRKSDSYTYQQIDRKLDFYGAQRNDSLYQAINMMEGLVAEGNKLYLVAGSAHILGNHELLTNLSKYKYIVLEAKSFEERQREFIQNNSGFRAWNE